MNNNCRRKFSEEEKKNILSKSANKCAHCGKKLNLNTMTVDHVYPINKGGGHEEYNLIAMCEKCNSKKSNFIYDTLSYLPYIQDQYCREYKKNLMKSVFNKSTDTQLFGQVSKIVYFTSKELYKVLASKKIKDTHKVLATFSKPVEIRLMYPGDLDDAIDLLNSAYILCGNKDEILENNKSNIVNKYVLQDMFRYCSFYGAYADNKIVAIRVYCNINNLLFYDNNELIRKELTQRGFKNTYVILLSAMYDRYSPLNTDFSVLETEMSAYTGNLVLNATSNPKKLTSAKMHNKIASAFYLKDGNDFIDKVYANKYAQGIILDNEEYDNRITGIKKYSNYFDTEISKNITTNT